MADRRFFEVAGPFTLGEIARLTGATLGDEGQSGRLMHDVAPLGSGAPDCLSFFDNRKYLAAFRETRAGAVLVSPAHAADAPEGTVALRTVDPYLAYAKAAAAFYPQERGDPSAPARIAAGAFVDPTARLGAGCSVGHGAVIEAGAEIGDGSSIGHHVVIGRGVVIGRDCRIDAQACVSHALVGDRVRLYPGVRIGQDGFGFASSAAGHVKVPQLGRVVIGDDVEIGANSAIDRGAGPDTVIGAGTIIDNLVQIGHNVVLGRACIIVAQVGIAGSTTLGNFVACGGQAGLNGHIKVGDGARIAAASAVVWDVDAGQTLFGVPALPMKQAMRQVAILDRMSKKKGDA